jgi:hypothetical protein
MAEGLYGAAQSVGVMVMQVVLLLLLLLSQ